MKEPLATQVGRGLILQITVVWLVAVVLPPPAPSPRAIAGRANTKEVSAPVERTPSTLPIGCAAGVDRSANEAGRATIFKCHSYRADRRIASNTSRCNLTAAFGRAGPDHLRTSREGIAFGLVTTIRLGQS
jgi:hypothetical protein